MNVLKFMTSHSFGCRQQRHFARRQLCRCLLLAFSGFMIAGALAAETVLELEKRIFTSTDVRRLTPLFRQYAVACLANGQAERGVRSLGAFIQQRGGQWQHSSMHGERLICLGAAADAFLLLQGWARHAPGSVAELPLLHWLIGQSNSDLARFVHLLHPADNWPMVMQILQTLYDHDPVGRDSYSELILALAVVFDQPRPPLHPQIGPLAPGPPLSVTRLYDYFTDLYGSGAAKLPLRELTAEALIFVVDIPVAAAELAWARQHVGGSISRWNQRFNEIRYDHARLKQQVFVWPHGTYTLGKIAEHGGICVDQAYFAAVTARIWGIPAVVLTGEGRRGPHAWFGYMSRPQQWNLDIGRHTRDRYTTGIVRDPQSNRSLTDHDLALLCDRAMQAPRLRPAAAYGRLAAVLLQLDLPELAAVAADAALARVPVYDLAWEIHGEILRRQNNWEQYLSLLLRKSTAFGAYPHRLAAIVQEQADVLIRLGNSRQAQLLLERQQQQLGRQQDDLRIALAIVRAQHACDQNDWPQAAAILEQALWDQRLEAYKLLSVLPAYIEISNKAGRAREAVRFLERLTRAIDRQLRQSPSAYSVLLRYLVVAYRNAGLDAKAEALAETGEL